MSDASLIGLQKWYDVIGCSNAVEDPLVTDSDDLKGLDEWTFACGKPIQQWDESAWVKASKLEDDGDPDDALQNHLGLPIFSTRLRQALDAQGIAGIQYLPLRVLRPDGSDVPGFSIANILNLVSALDLNKSDYDRYPDDYFLPQRRGQIAGIRDAVLRSGGLSGLDIIRLEEFPLHIAASERFKSAFNRLQLAGYGFGSCG